MGEKVEAHLAFVKRHLARFENDASYIAGYRSAVSDAAHVVDAIRSETEAAGRASVRKTEIVATLQSAGDTVYEMRKLVPEPKAPHVSADTGAAALTVSNYLLSPDINWNEAVRRLKQMRSEASPPTPEPEPPGLSG